MDFYQIIDYRKNKYVKESTELLMGSDYISRYTKVVSDSIFLNTYVKIVWIHLILQLGAVATSGFRGKAFLLKI